MDINKIISEAINEYINENIILTEDVFTEKSKEPKSIVKKGKKLKNGHRTDFDAKKERETNPNLNNQDNEDLSSIVDSDLIDVAALAKRVYPDHTPQGAQSQLRKKIKGLKSDSGSTYKLKKKEAFKIRRELAKEI